jgi:hypothetical protein
VTVDPSRLQAILDRLATQNPLGDEEREILAKAVRLGQSTLASGAQAVAIGGNADNVVIVTGDRNIVIPKELAEFLQGQAGNGGVNQNIGDQRTNVVNLYMLGGGSTGTTTQQVLQQVSILLGQLNQPETIQQASQNALPADINRSRLQTTDYEQIVAELDDFRRLPDFVQQLANDANVPPKIREKLLETIGRSPNSSLPVTPTSTLLQSHLLIVLKPDAISEKFRVNGWLIPDDMERDQAKRFKTLDIDESEKGISCGLDKVPQVLNDLLDLSLGHLMGKRYELTIEIFLPMDSLCTAVDAWKISDLFDEIPVGTMHRVVVRSCERLEPKYLASRLNQWYANWERVTGVGQANPSQDDFEDLGDFCDCNWKRVGNSLVQKLGLKLTCGLLDDHKRPLFTAILKAATPIALWSRCDLAHLDQVAEINALITSNPLLKLSEAVWRQRQQADEEDDPAMHLGSHLGILWEDPYRLTPDAMMQLMSPGQ